MEMELQHPVPLSSPFSFPFSFFSSTSSRLPPRDSLRLPDLARSALADPVFPALRSLACTQSFKADHYTHTFTHVSLQFILVTHFKTSIPCELTHM